MDERMSPSRLSEEDFWLYDQPELALVKMRREIENRLRWLEEHLAPGYPTKSTSFPGQGLVDRQIIDEATLGSIKKVLSAASPVVRGNRVYPSDAAILVGAGVSLIHGLDAMIQATEERLRELPPKTRLAYRFLELPTRRRWIIAKSLGVVDDSFIEKPGIELAWQVLLKAAEQDRLGEVWDRVADENRHLDKSGNPYKKTHSP